MQHKRWSKSSEENRTWGADMASNTASSKSCLEWCDVSPVFTEAAIISDIHSHTANCQHPTHSTSICLAVASICKKSRFVKTDMDKMPRKVVKCALSRLQRIDPKTTNSYSLYL